MPKLTIPLSPIAKQRARTVQRDGRAHTYTPTATVDAERTIAATWCAQPKHLRPTIPAGTPVALEVWAYFQNPKGAGNGLSERQQRALNTACNARGITVPQEMWDALTQEERRELKRAELVSTFREPPDAMDADQQIEVAQITLKGRALIGTYTATPAMTKPPDWDNIGKLISDALNGLAYVDDAQITDAYVHKRYAAAGDAARIEIEVTVVEEA